MVLAVTALAGVAGYVLAARTPPGYTATSSVQVGDLSASTTIAGAPQDTGNLGSTYADIARREPVLRPATKALQLDGSWQDLRQRVHAAPAPKNPRLVLITVEASSPLAAQLAANKIAEELVAVSPASTEVRDFVRTQRTILQRNITNAQEHVASLQGKLDNGTALIGTQSRIDALNRRINNWQTLYISLISLGTVGDPASLRVLEHANAADRVVPSLPLRTGQTAALGLLIAVALVYLLELRHAHPRQPDPVEGGRQDMMTRPGASAAVDVASVIGAYSVIGADSGTVPAVIKGGSRVDGSSDAREPR
jgi:hypothetical protein